MKNSTAASILAVVLATFSAPAYAAKEDFERCDGLKAPGKSVDGMNIVPSSFGFAFASGLGPKAKIDACKAALDDTRLTAEQTLRRAHLLRALALAHLADGQPDAALQDVEAAEIVAKALVSDPLFARSMGVSFTLVRAAAWRAKGDTARAADLAAKASAARPYSASIQRMSAAIAQRSWDYKRQAATPYQAILPLVPDAVREQFLFEVEAGHFDRAVQLFPRAKRAEAKLVAPVMFVGSGDLRPLLYSVVESVQAAYAYAAVGDVGRARTLLAETKMLLDAISRPGTAKDGSALPVNPLLPPLSAVVGQWVMLTDARIAVAEKRPMDALKALVGNAVPVNAAGVDLLTAVRSALPETQGGLVPDPATLAAKLEEQRKLRSLDVRALEGAMPAPETSNRLAAYKQSKRSILNGLVASGYQPDGFRSKENPETGVVTVEFTGQSTSAPVVEEMTLLRAAELGKQQGKRGLLIVARRDFARTLTMTRGYSAIPISSQPAGYKTELDVRFVDPANLPSDLASERDRVLDAEQVFQALAPVYIAGN